MADAFTPNLQVYGHQVVIKQITKAVFSENEVELFYQEVSLIEYFKGHKNIAKILGYCVRPYCTVHLTLNKIRFISRHTNI